MAQVYLDTNAFYFFFYNDEQNSPGVKRFFTLLHNGKYRAVTSALTLDELAYAVLLRLIEKKHKKRRFDVLRHSRQAIIEFLPAIQLMFDAVFSLNNLEIVDATAALVATMPQAMQTHLLLPRDALHARTA